MKKLVSAVLSLVIFISVSTMAFAESPYKHVFGMWTDSPEVGSGIMPFETFIGNGGSCTLDYMESGKHLAWSVSPDTPSSYTFTGEVTVKTQSGSIIWSFPCEMGGIGTVSGTFYIRNIGLSNGTSYRAELSGTAIDSNGRVYNVVPDASISFVFYAR